MGSRIGIDYGTVRIGIAKTDPAAKIAIPLTTILVSETYLTELVNLITDENPQCVYIGLPLSLKGEVTKSAEAALALASKISEKLPELTIRMIDERFTSKTANAQLQQAGLTTRETKGLVDQTAALAMLTHALEIETKSGKVAGVEFTNWNSK